MQTLPGEIFSMPLVTLQAYIGAQDRQCLPCDGQCMAAAVLLAAGASCVGRSRRSHAQPRHQLRVQRYSCVPAQLALRDHCNKDRQSMFQCFSKAQTVVPYLPTDATTI